MLREAIDGARALNGAEDGCVVTIAETGEPQDFITSGMTEEEHRQIERWADGQQMFRHLRDLPGPFRIADFATFAQSLGPGERNRHVPVRVRLDMDGPVLVPSGRRSARLTVPQVAWMPPNFSVR